MLCRHESGCGGRRAVCVPLRQATFLLLISRHVAWVKTGSVVPPTNVQAVCGSQSGGPQENNHVATLVISPYTHAVQDDTSYTHYSLLRTTEQLLGLPLLGNAASANSMLGKFGF